jgi:cytochrome c553
MKQLIKMIFAVGIVAASANVMAGADIKAGEEKATACVACHGASGVSVNPMFPTLAGQHADYMVQVLNAYKSGKRKNPIMQGTVAALSDEDIVNLAAYFASQTSLQTLKR